MIVVGRVILPPTCGGGPMIGSGALIAMGRMCQEWLLLTIVYFITPAATTFGYHSILAVCMTPIYLNFHSPSCIGMSTCNYRAVIALFVVVIVLDVIDGGVVLSGGFFRR